MPEITIRHGLQQPGDLAEVITIVSSIDIKSLRPMKLALATGVTIQCMLRLLLITAGRNQESGF